MTEYENVDTVMNLASSQITKMTNAQLKAALNTVLHTRNQEEPANSILLEEIKSLKEEVREMKTIRER